MLPRHRMIVALAFIALMGFMFWRGFDDADTGYYVRLPEPLLDGPRNAIPANPPSDWVISRDYPSIALEGDIAGKSGFTVTVSPFGEVSSCTITKSSGYPELDDRACNAISTRARFHPALNADDQPVEGSYASTVSWELE